MRMTIISKAQADKILVNSLFQPVNGKTLSRMKYCNGKYKPGVYIGREIECASDDVKAIYPQSGRDSEGAYVHLMCITAI